MLCHHASSFKDIEISLVEIIESYPQNESHTRKSSITFFQKVQSNKDTFWNKSFIVKWKYLKSFSIKWKQMI